MIKHWFRNIYYFLLKNIPFLHVFYATRCTQTPVTMRYWFMQKVLGFNRSVYWPAHFTSVIQNHRNIEAGIDTAPGYSQGCYIQGLGGIIVGDYTQIGPGVGLISTNHDSRDNRRSLNASIIIGRYCWIGMNAVILPGVTLGDYTIVGAGAIVTKSFPEGYCLIAGNPAKLIKPLEPDQCVHYEYEQESQYNGYISHADFKRYRARYCDR